MDKGPWKATLLYVGSDDFKYDVSLEINGDFAEGERDKYAEWLAKELNDCAALRARVAVLEGAVEWACDGFRASRFRSDDGFGSFRNELRRRAKEG